MSAESLRAKTTKAFTRVLNEIQSLESEMLNKFDCLLKAKRRKGAADNHELLTLAFCLRRVGLLYLHGAQVDSGLGEGEYRPRTANCSFYARPQQLTHCSLPSAQGV
jgi:hypothetical protein